LSPKARVRKFLLIDIKQLLLIDRVSIMNGDNNAEEVFLKEGPKDVNTTRTKVSYVGLNSGIDRGYEYTVTLFKC
jgi:hypothetical protein